MAGLRHSRRFAHIVGAAALHPTTGPTCGGRAAPLAALLDQLVIDPYWEEAVKLGIAEGELVHEWALGMEDGRETVINLMTTLASVLRTGSAAIGTEAMEQAESWSRRGLDNRVIGPTILSSVKVIVPGAC
jgi:hypothetical protein